jgi:hypothetical protein
MIVKGCRAMMIRIMVWFRHRVNPDMGSERERQQDRATNQTDRNVSQRVSG